MNPHQPEPFIITIFGASGDLSARKLLPALLYLEHDRLLPHTYCILGVGRTSFSDQQFREKAGNALKEHAATVNATVRKKFLKRLHYHVMNTSDSNDYIGLKQKLTELDISIGSSRNFLYYLATPPVLYQTIIGYLSTQGLNREEKQGWKRVIIEKPFGYDLKTARQLNKEILKSFKENQIYRIDHYLGKETVQNILVTRFANSIFEPVWNRHYIERIEITSAESIGVENRGGYYDKAGAVRDMIQNHLLQILGMIALEPPVNAEADSIRNETLKVFQSLRPISIKDMADQVIRGQYLASTIQGKKVAAYRQEKGVAPDSQTETFVAMKLFVDNPRWKDVPFFIRYGKRMPVRVTEVVVRFKPVAYTIFEQGPTSAQNNTLIIRIQPDEGILLTFGLKTPGTGFEVSEKSLDFHYSSLEQTRLSEAYERLLLDCVKGDQTLYLRGDAVEATWKFIDPVLQAWQHHSIKLYGYPAGTWGPKEADKLIGKGATWRYPCKNLTSDTGFCQL
ncbi:MAG: glucose-6-phosphate dehydrogenase [Bacteroidales bacterium]|jgi:glucose-6-phosphate 1-dehydrogenase|nr:glucose-6-phosphate dehydrogenase [Bacteroidales bacterium]